jgi:formylglycine-generating enzyme required for sulfatase activity
MKLTPLGKALIFVIGLALVVTAVYKYVPAEKWHGWLGKHGSQAAPAPDSQPAAEGTTASSAREESPAEETTAASGTEEPSLSASDWVAIPGGLFRSGPDQSEVDVPPFLIERTEVTNGQYEAFLNECAAGSSCGPRDVPSYWEDTAYLDTRRDHPVVFVTWGDAAAFCRWEGGRLPTALEWEKAARGTDGRSFPTGGAIDPAAVNILGSDRRDEKARAPKQIPTWGVRDRNYARDSSPYGVLAMAGNVSEWTASASEDEPDLRLAAGGSWDSWDLNDGRTYYRIPKNPTDRSSSLGFRCASASK